jgi:poly-gamma-glutamate capsule biosynthesis protein CapA/YwtB (metallophosphatase superfamily)
MQRRRLLGLSLLAAFGAACRSLHAAGITETRMPAPNTGNAARHVRLFLCGDVMAGRGIDQILPHPSSPRIHEPFMTSAADYVKIAERASGPIPHKVDFSYVWGDALAVLQEAAVDVRIINLETAVTRSDDYWPGKGINYRMHPANVPCLTAAGIDCCALANNHVLDWGYAGLRETLQSLHQAGMHTAGAGANSREAMSPAVMTLDGDRRVLVFSMGSTSSGIGRAWSAAAEKPGVWLLPDLSRASLDAVAGQVAALKQPGDIVIASIHWGGNWGYEIPREQRRFAHALIDHAGIDLVHGHSSHHPRAIEVYHDKLVLYGCGDFINDYEGISGYEEFRGDLTLMYLPVIDPADGRLAEMTLHVMQMHRFRLRRASAEDSRWVATVLDRESSKFGACIKEEGQHLRLCTVSG